MINENITNNIHETERNINNNIFDDYINNVINNDDYINNAIDNELENSNNDNNSIDDKVYTNISNLNILNNDDNVNNLYKCSILNITNLFIQYKNNKYILNKINNIIYSLNNGIEKIAKEKEEKDKHRNEINREKDVFINKFLKLNNYSYLCELFFKYDGKHFTIYKEDDIHYEILTLIRNNSSKLLDFKQKIKNNILKMIKDISPFNYTPHKDTIEYIMSELYPNIFKDKESVKYFLTAIGDTILKKNEDLIYIIPPHFKHVCTRILYYGYKYLGISINSIKYKYHGHSYDNCRLIKVNENIENIENNILSKDFYNNIVDLFVVSTYYSKKYESADYYIENTSNIELYDYVFYLKNNKLENIINNFIKSYTEITEEGINIKWKEMLYLWKLFLDKQNIPNIVFFSKLKSILQTLLAYNEEIDSFINIKSSYLVNNIDIPKDITHDNT